MNWLQNNLLGMVLAAISGVFALLAMGMAIIWTLPVSVEIAETETEQSGGGDTVLVAHQIAALSDFQVINDKPVFNESRQPVVGEEDNNDDEAVEDKTVAVRDAPKVRLTGVIITPSIKLASLTPANGKLENVMAHEGQPLTGEFVGWRLSAIHPRSVVLKSLDGQTLKLGLQVHDTKIKEPPKPVVPKKTDQSRTDQGEQMVDEDGQPLSRAEQIRQRIAERREELRLEQEEQQAQKESRSSGGNQSAKTQDYQSAIRDMMRNKSKDHKSDDDEDG